MKFKCLIQDHCISKNTCFSEKTGNAFSSFSTMFSKIFFMGTVKTRECLMQDKCVLTFYPTIPTFIDSGKKSLFKTLWEKEKMLVISIFSFSHNVFYPSQKEFLCLSYICFVAADALNLDQSINLLFGKGLN